MREKLKAADEVPVLREVAVILFARFRQPPPPNIDLPHFFALGELRGSHRVARRDQTPDLAARIARVGKVGIIHDGILDNPLPNGAADLLAAQQPGEFLRRCFLDRFAHLTLPFLCVMMSEVAGGKVPFPRRYRKGWIG